MPLISIINIIYVYTIYVYIHMIYVYKNFLGQYKIYKGHYVFPHTYIEIKSASKKITNSLFSISHLHRYKNITLKWVKRVRQNPLRSYFSLKNYLLKRFLQSNKWTQLFDFYNIFIINFYNIYIHKCVCINKFSVLQLEKYLNLLKNYYSDKKFSLKVLNLLFASVNKIYDDYYKLFTVVSNKSQQQRCHFVTHFAFIGIPGCRYWVVVVKFWPIWKHKKQYIYSPTARYSLCLISIHTLLSLNLKN